MKRSNFVVFIHEVVLVGLMAPCYLSAQINPTKRVNGYVRSGLVHAREEKNRLAGGIKALYRRIQGKTLTRKEEAQIDHLRTIGKYTAAVLAIIAISGGSWALYKRNKVSDPFDDVKQDVSEMLEVLERVDILNIKPKRVDGILRTDELNKFRNDLAIVKNKLDTICGKTGYLELLSRYILRLQALNKRMNSLTIELDETSDRYIECIEKMLQDFR